MGQPVIVHDFQEQLKFSQEASDEPFWDAIYRKAFPGMVGHIVTRGSTNSQRLGVDRVIHLSSGKTLYIDEKKRRKVWPDILLEYISVDTARKPGWIEKDLVIDYLAYAFMPIQRVHLFPWELLRRAWICNKKSWLEKYRVVSARNNGYSTLSVPVPIDVLHGAVKTVSVIQL